MHGGISISENPLATSDLLLMVKWADMAAILKNLTAPDTNVGSGSLK